MNVTVQALVQAAASKVAEAQLSFIKAGTVLQAVVLGPGSSGLTELKIGEVIVQAALPQPVAPGTTLTLQVKSGGALPQLVVVPTAIPPPASPTPLPAPITTLPLPLAAAPQSGAAPISQPAPLPTAPAAAPTPAPALVAVPAAAQTAPATAVQPTVSGPLPQDSRPPAVAAAVRSAALPAEAPQAVSAPAVSVQAQGARVVSVPLQQSATNAAVPSAGPAILAVVAPPPAPVPVPSQPAVASTAVQPAPMLSEQGRAASPAVVVVSPQPAALAATGSAPPVLTAQAPVVQSVPPVSVQAPASPEAVATSPLLVAQAAPRPVATTADLPRATTPVASPALPPVSSQGPATSAQALAQMGPVAIAKQNSLAPLLQSLAALVSRPSALPEPIVRAALSVLAQRIAVPAGKLAPEALESAIRQSGVFLETGLAQGTPTATDTKSALLALRGALEKWLGGPPAAVPAGDRSPPPVRGQVPRAAAIPSVPVAVPEAPREAARLLHSQTDAAVSRVKLGQLASLPETDKARPVANELRFELPFLIGSELVMAQIQISRDSARREVERKRGWTMRFAMNFSGTGEVGADVGLLGKAVNVTLWAAEPETAEALSAALPELSGSLEALGLLPGAVRVRRGVPDAGPVRSGQLLDSAS